jgi:PBSX family phage terminase large subunit
MDEASEIVEGWIPFLSAKQKAVFDCYKMYVLCCGGRRNGKSIAVGHKVMRHMVETPGAEVALISTTIKTAKEGGAFQDMVNIIYPIWESANIYGSGGFKVEFTSKGGNGLPGPRMDAATRTSSFRIRNIHGGESSLTLFSINNENEIESVTRSKRFSMVWISEGSNFKSDKIFKEVAQMLRMYHLNKEDHQLIVDTNPAEEGDAHWIYQKWFVDRLRDSPPKELMQTKENPTGITQEDWVMIRDHFALFEFQLEDNPRLSKLEIAELKASNCDNQGEYDRNILGKWVKGHGLKGKVFADILLPEKHFIGTDPDEAIDISETTIDLVSGWDMGKVNHAGVIVEPIMVDRRYSYNVLEECMVLDEKVSIDEYAFQMWEKMRGIERYYQRRFNWTHYSDDSAFNFNPHSGEIDATIVYNATGGEVSLEAANKAKNSVDAGIKFMRQLLHTNRLFVGSNCPRIREMLEQITDRDIEDDTHLKHPFDALRYVIYMMERKFYFETAPRSVNRTQEFIHVQ